MRHLPYRFRPGELSGADADALNELAQRVSDLYGMDAAPPLEITQSAAGVALGIGALSTAQLNIFNQSFTWNNDTITFVSDTFIINANDFITVNFVWQWTLNQYIKIVGPSFFWLQVPILLGLGGYIVQGVKNLDLSGAATFNDVNTSGASWIVITNSQLAGSTINGFVAPAPAAGDVGGNTMNGRHLTITNLSSNDVLLGLNAGGSTAGNRIQLVGSANAGGRPNYHVIRPEETVELKYSYAGPANPSATNFWAPLLRLPHWRVGDTVQGTAPVGDSYRSRLNLVAGTGIGLTPKDDFTTDTFHVTIANTAGTGFPASESGIGLLGGDVSVVDQPTWTATTCSVTLPTAGATYLLVASVNGQFLVSNVLSSASGGILTRLFNVTQSAQLGSTMSCNDDVSGVTPSSGTANVTLQATNEATVVTRYTTIAANEVVRVEGMRRSGPTYSVSKICGGGTANTSLIFWRVN